jgi:hypothetical protein
MSLYIYALLLENDKYYIGITRKPNFNFNKDFNSKKSSWTRKYSPKKVIEIIPNCNYSDKDKYTLKYMEKYGIDNVRGGQFDSYHLRNKEKTIITDLMSKKLLDKCSKCDEIGHIATECNNRQNEINEMLEVDSSDSYLNNYYPPPIAVYNEIIIPNFFGCNYTKTFTIEICPVINQNLNEIKKSPFAKSIMIYFLKKIIGDFKIEENNSVLYNNFITEYNKFIKEYKIKKEEYNNKISDVMKLISIYLYGKTNFKSITSYFDLCENSDDKIEMVGLSSKYRDLRRVSVEKLDMEEYVTIKIKVADTNNAFISEIEFD